MPVRNKVIVIRKDALPESHPSQMFFCTGGSGSAPNPSGRAVFAVSLATGERCRFNRGDVIGIPRPEFLPDEARLQLSQIRPDGARDVKDPQYSGYCFLEDGRYSAGVWLRDAQEAAAYMKMQALWQSRVLLCDRDDFAVAEMIRGELVHPMQGETEDFRQGGGQERTGGMKMT